MGIDQHTTSSLLTSPSAAPYGSAESSMLATALYDCQSLFFRGSVLIRKVLSARCVFPDTETHKTQRGNQADDSTGQRELIQEASGIETFVFPGQPVPSPK